MQILNSGNFEQKHHKRNIKILISINDAGIQKLRIMYKIMAILKKINDLIIGEIILNQDIINFIRRKCSMPARSKAKINYVR